MSEVFKSLLILVVIIVVFTAIASLIGHYFNAGNADDE